jgi:hypothetical protein
LTGGDFLLWLVWAAFGTVLMVLVVTRYVRPIFSEGGSRSAVGGTAPAGGPAGPEGAWLFCEDGAPLDQRAAWFRVRSGGATVLGNTPRGPVGDTTFVYLSAHDIRDRQVTIRWDTGRRRYVLEKGEGIVRHNNELVPDGAALPLTDGDTIELGEITRMRFTYTGPPPEAVGVGR